MDTAGRVGLVELWIKVEPGEAATATDEFLEFLRRNGFDTEGDPQTKTRAAPRYFTTRVGFDDPAGAEGRRRGRLGSLDTPTLRAHRSSCSPNPTRTASSTGGHARSLGLKRFSAD